jgi:hypothetical protein
VSRRLTTVTVTVMVMVTVTVTDTVTIMVNTEPVVWTATCKIIETRSVVNWY